MAHIIRFGEAIFDFSYFGQLYPDHPPEKVKGKYIMAWIYFIPRNRAEQRAWWLNLKTEIPTVGPALGLSAEDIAAVVATCSAQIDLIDEVIKTETAYNGALEAEKMGMALNGTAIKESINDWKGNPTMTAEIAAKLKITTSKSEFDPDAWKCEFTVKILHGEIRIDWKKKGVQFVHIYSRLAGQTQWTLIGTDSSSPYIDGRPLANPAVPETREYMIRGVIEDQEIGLDSDVQSVTWKGQ